MELFRPRPPRSGWIFRWENAAKQVITDPDNDKRCREEAMGAFSKYAITGSGTEGTLNRYAKRGGVYLFAMLLMGMIGIGAEESKNPPADLIQDKLGNVSMDTASRDLLAEAVKQAVTGNREQAKEILAAALSIPRKDQGMLVGPFVVGAVVGLGPEVRKNNVAALVRTAVERRPNTVLRIVASAVHAAPCGYANDIAAAAVAALRNPSDRLVAKIYDVASKTKCGNAGENLEPVGEELNQMAPLAEIPPLPPNLIAAPTATPGPVPPFPPSPSF